MSTQKTDSKAVEFIYQDTEIHFLLGNEKNVMVNATEMAKPFGKLVADFLRLDSTKSYVESYLKIQNSDLYYGISHNINEKITESDMFYSKQKSGTFMIRPLAIKFAAWLDSDFEVWIYETIDKLLFGKAKNVTSKISEAEKKKIDIAILIERVKKIGNEDMNKLLMELDELKKIENEKKKAVRQFSSQYKMF